MPPTKTGKNMECHECGHEIYVPKWKLESNKNHFCSHKCHNKFQTTTVEQECAYCGDVIAGCPSEITKFCSTQCYGKSRTKSGNVIYNCDYCENSFKIHKHRKETQENCFCSDECTSEWRSEEFSGKSNPKFNDGKYRGFGENWISIREKVWERSGGNCECCDKSKEENGRNLSVHHIIPRRKFINHTELSVEESNFMENLIALCQTCHQSAEYGDSYYPTTNGR